MAKSVLDDNLGTGFKSYLASKDRKLSQQEPGQSSNSGISSAGFKSGLEDSIWASSAETIPENNKKPTKTNPLEGRIGTTTKAKEPSKGGLESSIWADVPTPDEVKPQYSHSKAKPLDFNAVERSLDDNSHSRRSRKRGGRKKPQANMNSQTQTQTPPVSTGKGSSSTANIQTVITPTAKVNWEEVYQFDETSWADAEEFSWVGSNR